MGLVERDAEVALLLELADRGPLVIIVDDAQHADLLSLQCLLAAPAWHAMRASARAQICLRQGDLRGAADYARSATEPGRHPVRRPTTAHGYRAETLTDAERRVAALAAQGYTNRRISSKLYITISTVEQHLTRVYRKLNVKRRKELPVNLYARIAGTA